MAEAKLIDKPFDVVWNDYSSEDDVASVIKIGKLCEMTADKIAKATQENIHLAEQYMAAPEVWRAILQLADSLKYGRTSGRTAAAMLIPALDLTSHP